MAREPASFRAHPTWRAAAIFCFGAGAVIALILLWRWVAGDFAPFFEADPAATWVRLLLELATAIAMFAAGYGLVTGARWVRKFYLIATGMLIVNGATSLANYMDSGRTWIIVLHLAVAVVALAFVLRVED
jgi:hypothetical protein